MQIVCFIFSFYFLNFSLIKSYTNAQTTTSTTNVKGNVPIIKSSSPDIFFEEQFQDKTKWINWIRSEGNRDGVDEHISKYDGEWAFENPESSVYIDNYGLILKSKGKHSAISVHLTKPFDFSSKYLIVQYEVKFQTNQECGGAYLKLLSYDDNYPDLKQVTDKTPYTIMFGPDMCSSDYKYHFIIRFRNPKSGNYTEHQAKKSSESIQSYFTDKISHLYTLILSDDNEFKMFIDNKLINSGNLLEDMEPSIIPSKEINDENDRKPVDWDEREKVIDTNAKKPDDWDEKAPKEILDRNAKPPNGWLENEPLTIPDPNATKPEDWNDEMDGVWEAPTIENPLCKIAPGCGQWTLPKIPNPAYKGPWSAPLINNPNYRGVWKPRKIPNPNYFEDIHPYQLTPIGSVALEIWSMVDGIVFDNFLITSDQAVAKQYADKLWDPKSILEGRSIPSSSSTSRSTSSKNILDTIINATNKRPWLWAVYVAVIILPIILLIGIYCWLREPNTNKNRYKRKKKKDDYTEDEDENEDDEIDDDDDDNSYEDETKNDKHKTKSKKLRKEALEKPPTGHQSRRRTRKE